MHEQPSLNPWPLSAPESLVLLWGPTTSDVPVIEVALIELVARGYLDLRERQRPVIVRRFLAPERVVVHARQAFRTGSASLDAILTAVPDVHVAADPAAGYPVRTLADRVLSLQVSYQQRRNPRKAPRRVLTGRGYVWYVVLPELVRRGYFAHDAREVEARLKPTNVQITPAGMQALAVIRQLVNDGRGPFGMWVASDRARAWDYLERARSGVFLYRGLIPHLRQLAAAETARSATLPDPGVVNQRDGERFYVSPPIAAAALLQVWSAGDMDQVFNLIGRDVQSAWDALLRDARERGTGE